MFSWQRRNRRPLLLTLCVSLSAFSPAHALWPFPSQRYTGNSLLDGGSLGLDPDVRVVALADLNADQYLDVITLSSDQRTLSVYIWDHRDYTFTKSQSLSFSQNVQNVVPGDFTHDGRVDLMIMSTVPSGSWWEESTQVGMTVYLGLGGGAFSTTPIPVPASATSHPIVLDANGDMQLDLLGTTPAPSSGGSPVLQLWKNTWNASDTSGGMFTLVSPPLDPSQACTLSTPHSSAVVDLDGDCLADLFLVCDTPGSTRKTYQIWTNTKGSGFTLARKGLLPEGAGPVTFADIDRDGTIDLLFPTCSSLSPSTGIGTDCYLNIAYNRQLPLCPDRSSLSYERAIGACRAPDDLCVADGTFEFDLEGWEDNDAFSRIPLSSLSPTHPSSLLLLDTSLSPPLPLPLRLADTSLSGFPSLLLLTATASGSGTDTQVEMLESVRCTEGVQGCEGGKTRAGRRAFRPLTTGAEALSAIKDARGVTVLDIDENGSLDILVQRTGAQAGVKTTFVQNNFYHDAFFLKAIVLNGACSGWCRPSEGEKYKPFGSSYPGPSFKYTILDTFGTRSAAQGDAVAQLPQTGYQALLPPYSLLGLGRTNNYVENLFVGSSLSSPPSPPDSHYTTLEGVIPNSRVVINPPPPGPAAGGSREWETELFLRPGEWIPWVTLAAVGATGCLAVIVGVLHMYEKREDERERRRALHHINFDAL